LKPDPARWHRADAIHCSRRVAARDPRYRTAGYAG